MCTVKVTAAPGRLRADLFYAQRTMRAAAQDGALLVRSPACAECTLLPATIRHQASRQPAWNLN